jgi:hypothetical protein
MIPVVALALLLGSGVAYAQTSTATTTPGAPNTGTGGEALPNAALLASAAGIAGASFYLLRRKQS